MKQQHKINLTFEGNQETIQTHLQYLINELDAIGIEALVDSYQNSKLIRSEVKKRVKKYKQQKAKESPRKPSAFDKLPSS